MGKFVNEEFKEETMNKVEEGKQFVKSNRGYFYLAGAFVLGVIFGHSATKARYNNKMYKAVLNAKESARNEYADELLKEAMKYSVEYNK